MSTRTSSSRLAASQHARVGTVELEVAHLDAALEEWRSSGRSHLSWKQVTHLSRGQTSVVVAIVLAGANETRTASREGANYGCRCEITETLVVLGSLATSVRAVPLPRILSDHAVSTGSALPRSLSVVHLNHSCQSLCSSGTEIRQDGFGNRNGLSTTHAPAPLVLTRRFTRSEGDDSHPQNVSQSTNHILVNHCDGQLRTVESRASGFTER